MQRTEFGGCKWSGSAPGFAREGVANISRVADWRGISYVPLSMLSPSIVFKSLGFSLLMGLIGGFLSAVRAARLDIIQALRAARVREAEFEARRVLGLLSEAPRR